MSRKPRSEVRPLPSASLPTELPPAPSTPPPPLVVPPRRLAWLVSRAQGRPLAHAFVIGSARTVCRLADAIAGSASVDGFERCGECVRIVVAIEAPDAPSVPNLSGD